MLDFPLRGPSPTSRTASPSRRGRRAVNAAVSKTVNRRTGFGGSNPPLSAICAQGRADSPASHEGAYLGRPRRMRRACHARRNFPPWSSRRATTGAPGSTCTTTRSPGVWLLIAKKGSRAPDRVVRRSLGSGALLRLDRRPEAAPRRQLLAAEVHSARRQERVVEKLNRQRAEELITRGEMRPTGLAEVERAKSDGRWAHAYDSPRTQSCPAIFRPPWRRIPRRRPSSRRSTAPTATRSSGGCRPPRRPRRASGACGSSSRCWSGTRSCIR